MSQHPEATAEVAGERPSDGPVRLAILALFFLSGACALTYEVVWMRMLTLVFGATAFATSTILASLFAGLALGGVYFGRMIDRGRSPLVVYALLEAGIGVFAFLMPVLFAVSRGIYVAVAQQVAIGFFGISVVRFVLSFAALLIPATLMGGTLPVLVKFFATRQERLGWHVGQLYAVNTLGAVAGTLAAGFFLILWLGVKEAAYAAGAVNLCIAATAWALCRRVEGSAAEPVVPPAASPAPDAGGDTPSSEVVRLALWAIGISGFCALAFEVFWTRTLVFFLDNSTHAFTTILTAFLLGIGIGSFIVARFVDRRKQLVAWLGWVEVLIGASAILAIPLLSNLPHVFQSLADVTPDAWLPWKWMGLRFANSLAVMLVPTILMGMAFPLASKLYARNVAAVGTALGNVYAVNTVGGVLGSVLAGFVLIPAIGVQNGIMVVAAVNVVIGGLLIVAEPAMTLKVKRATVAGVGTVAVAVGGIYAVRGPTTLTSYYEGVESPEVLSYEEGIGATVKVYRDRIGDKTLSINGFPVAGTAFSMQDAQKPLAHLPLLLSKAPAPRVNIVGFGAGGTSWGVMQHAATEVDCVELVPAVPRQATWFPEVNHGVRDEPGFNLIMGDGRNYALVSDKEYDVISVDATSPKMAGNGSLYALEFYRLLKARLSPEGMLVQWIPYHLLSDAETRMIAKTFLTAFPHTTLWFTPLRQYVILLGTQEALDIDYALLSVKLEQPAVRQDLALFDIADPVDVLSLFVMGEDALAAYVGDAGLNTDNHPYLEFTPAMAYFVSDVYFLQNLRAFAEARESVFPLLSDVGGTDDEIARVAQRLERRFEARHFSIRGDQLLFLGLREQANAEYNRALEIDPEERNWLNTGARYSRPGAIAR